LPIISFKTFLFYQTQTQKLTMFFNIALNSQILFSYIIFWNKNIPIPQQTNLILELVNTQRTTHQQNNSNITKPHKPFYVFLTINGTNVKQFSNAHMVFNLVLNPIFTMRTDWQLYIWELEWKLSLCFHMNENQSCKLVQIFYIYIYLDN